MGDEKKGNEEEIAKMIFSDLKVEFSKIWKKLDKDIVKKLEGNNFDEKFKYAWDNLHRLKNKKIEASYDKTITILETAQKDFNMHIEAMIKIIKKHKEPKAYATKCLDEFEGYFRCFSQEDQIFKGNVMIKNIVSWQEDNEKTLKEEYEKKLKDEFTELDGKFNKLHQYLQKNFGFLKECTRPGTTNIEHASFELSSNFTATRVKEFHNEKDKILCASLGEQKKCAILQKQKENYTCFYSRNFAEKNMKFESLQLDELKYHKGNFSLHFSPDENHLVILCQMHGFYVIKFENQHNHPSVKYYNEKPYNNLMCCEWKNNTKLLLLEKEYHFHNFNIDNREISVTKISPQAKQIKKDANCLLVSESNIYFGVIGKIYWFEDDNELTFQKEWDLQGKDPKSIKLAEDYIVVGMENNILIFSNRKDKKLELVVEIEKLKFISISLDCKKILAVSKSKVEVFELLKDELKSSSEINLKNKLGRDNSDIRNKVNYSGIVNWNNKHMLLTRNNNVFKIEFKNI